MVGNIEESLPMTKWMVMVNLLGHREKYIKEIMKMMKNMDLGKWHMEIDHHIKVIGFVVNNMEKVFTLIMLEEDMKVIGKMVEWSIKCDYFILLKIYMINIKVKIVNYFIYLLCKK